MNEYFNNSRTVATSSRSENYFGQMKRSLLKNKTPLRVDKFLVKHCRQIDADMKLARASVNNHVLQKNPFNKKKDAVKIVQDDSHDYLYEVETWRNQHTIVELEETENYGAASVIENQNQNCEEIKEKSANIQESMLNDNFAMIEPPKIPSNEYCTVIEKQLDIFDNLSDIPIIEDEALISFNENIMISSSLIEEKKEIPVKIRGTYVRPAPEFDIHLQTGKESIRSTKGSKGNIRNGGTLQSKLLDRWPKGHSIQYLCI